MNILLLSPWFPWPPFGGALIRVFETLRYLSQRHQVTLVAPITRPSDAVGVSPLHDWCSRVVAVPVSEGVLQVGSRLGAGLIRGMPLIQGVHYDPNMARRLRQLTSDGEYDVIHIEHSFMAPYLASVSPVCEARRVLTMHNIESLRFDRELRYAAGMRRLALLTDHVLFGSWEESAVRQFDAIAAVSAREQAWIRAHAPTAAVEVLPNGVNTEEFSMVDLPRKNQSVIFMGLMNYPPNIDAALWFCDAILPLLTRRHPELQFFVVGDKPTPRVRALARRPGVHVTGRVPDVRPYLANSLAVVVPLRSGAGTRLKILEAMAAGRPVISTSLGAEGLDVTDGEDILVGDTQEEFAACVLRVLHEADLRTRLARAARHLVESKYDWPLCLSKLENLYQAQAVAPGSPERIQELAS